MDKLIPQPKSAAMEDVIAAYQRGEMVILMDDVDRENEGDIAIATEKITKDAVAFMMQHARGQICVSINSETAKRLNLPLQVLHNASQFQTPFAISVDHKDVASCGVTAEARAYTMKRLIDENSKPEDFVSPGHVFPLIVNPAGVIGRHGQTEGSHDLAVLAGLFPSGVICEILNPDGSMAKGCEIAQFAAKHQQLITSVEELIHYRVAHEVLLEEVACRPYQTGYGEFTVHVFEDKIDGKEHMALVYGTPQADPLVRVHSECLTGDVFGSRRCDCGAQLDLAMKKIVSEGSGVLIYLRQEGRGIGLGNKLKAYALQDKGADTVEANVKLGFAPDLRNYAVAAKILNSLNIQSIRLITNNPDKIKDLERSGITIKERIPAIVATDEYSEHYIQTKREKMGHLI